MKQKVSKLNVHMNKKEYKLSATLPSFAVLFKII